MTVSTGSAPGAQADPRTPEQEAAIKSAGAWINQFSRTLKTCRLYDGNNPTVIRFREDLTHALRRTLDEHGPLTYRFHSDDVLFDGVSLYPARSRDDNLAYAFYRDGIHALTFTPGVQPREAEALLDALLQVSGQNAGEDDLVTLLWQSQLEHIDIEYVPAEGDVGTQAGEAEAEATLMPWPTGTAAEETPGGEEAPAAGGGEVERSDDWATGDLTVEVEAAFEELDALASSEIPRLMAEHKAEHEVPVVSATLAIANAYLGSGTHTEDQAELARFLPRVLRLALGQGAWIEARETLLMLRRCDNADWSPETFSQELLQPISIASAVAQLDAQPAEAIDDCIAFAQELGEPAVDWLNLVLADSQQRRTRRVLAEAIANLCRDNPERLAPWLADPRWYVVRNIVHILGWIGGSEIVGLLQVAARNPEARVRQEVVAALGQVEPRAARGLLMRMLDGADTRLLCSILHQLSANRDPAVARLLHGYLVDAAFETRPLEERRAIYSAMSATAGDEIVPDLEVELHKGNWFSRYQEAHRLAIARCLARIGTPTAQSVLQRGILSRRGPVRKACEDALAGVNERD
jgi:hypothetical protein